MSTDFPQPRAAEAQMSGIESVFRHPPGGAAGAPAAGSPDAVPESGQLPAADPPGSRAAAVAAAAAVALAGGLVWAGVVIATRMDLGILALLVGAATGFALARVLRGGVHNGDRLLAGALAAAGIVVGKYVIFVHDVKSVLGGWLAAHEHSIGYLDTKQMSIFIHNMRHIVHPIYVIWIAFAFVAAYRAAAGGPAPATHEQLQPEGTFVPAQPLRHALDTTRPPATLAGHPSAGITR